MSALYTFAGFSPNDGLGEGRWVPRPGAGGVQDWVGELESKSAKPTPNVGQCLDCETTINHRATRYRSCAVRHRQKKATA